MLVLTIGRFDADPAEVSTILDLQPSRIARKGDISPVSGRTYKHNQWFIDVHPEPLTSGAEHEAGLADILALLRSREHQFAMLREKIRPETIEIYGGLYHRPQQQCGIWLERDQMRILADCGVSWGLDIFTGE